MGSDVKSDLLHGTNSNVAVKGLSTISKSNNQVHLTICVRFRQESREINLQSPLNRKQLRFSACTCLWKKWTYPVL